VTEMTQEIWQGICADTATKMIKHIQPFLTPISVTISEDEGKHLGSGSYFEIENKTFVITNEHVAKYSNRNVLTHQFHNKEDILKIIKPFSYEAAPVDVAISEIPGSSWKQSKHSAQAIPFSRIANSHSPEEHECLFFAGYSGERSKFLFGHLITPGTPYLTQECQFPTDVDEADCQYHFSLFYPPDLAVSVDGASHLPDPHGFSGSLVWDTKRVACLNADKEWSPDMAVVTGIVWGWPSSSACILATKIEHIDFDALTRVETNA
jgi:hypothetical protein